MIKSINKYFQKNTEAAPLAVFRIFFGLMMLVSLIRFWANGWIDELYIKPNFSFSYYGFEWVKPLGNYTYLLFILCALSSVFVAVGYKYRIAIITFFLSFTYIELMDKTYYLNHYYFISLMSFLLIFLPTNATFSVDAYLKKNKYQTIPKWTIDSVKLLLGIVYFYAGLAKLNSEWLFRAQPLKIWLSSKTDLPLIGQFMNQEWFHYAMSWSGAIYDLSIPFLLFYKRTRPIAFLFVIFFHIMTHILFPKIGMFPLIMTFSVLIFFDAKYHQAFLNFLKQVFSLKIVPHQEKMYLYKNQKIIEPFIIAFFVIQLIFPFRYLLYPGELFWTEEGYRFSWRVMLVEKAGFTDFKVVDKDTKRFFYVDNRSFLTQTQEKQMNYQPDFILQFAHFLGDFYKENGIKNPQVFVDCVVTLNGRLSKPLIDPKIDLYQEKESFKHKKWVLPFNDKIKIYGL